MRVCLPKTQADGLGLAFRGELAPRGLSRFVDDGMEHSDASCVTCGVRELGEAQRTRQNLWSRVAVANSEPRLGFPVLRTLTCRDLLLYSE